jgi:hypothetical protein
MIFHNNVREFESFCSVESENNKKEIETAASLTYLVGSGYLMVPYLQIRNYLTVWYRQIRIYMTVPLKKGERGEGCGREVVGRVGTGGSGSGAIESRAGGDNIKRGRSAQRRVGPTPGAHAPRSPVRASFP